MKNLALVVEAGGCLTWDGELSLLLQELGVRIDELLRL